MRPFGDMARLYSMAKQKIRPMEGQRSLSPNDNGDIQLCVFHLGQEWKRQIQFHRHNSDNGNWQGALIRLVDCSWRGR
jgi:hypothetical protein